MKKLVFGLFVFCCAVGMLATGTDVWAAADDAIRPMGTEAALGGQPIFVPLCGMIVNSGGQGDALIAPVYKTSRSMLDGVTGLTIPLNFVTYFTIANNSETFSRISVRLRSGKQSVEVWDNYFTLSPHKVVWFQVGLSSDNVPVLSYEGVDQEPLISPSLLKEVGFIVAAANAAAKTAGHLVPGDTGFVAPGTVAYQAFMVNYYNLEMITGEIEVIGVGSGLTEDTINADCPNVLIGNVMMGDFTNGVYLGYQMTAIRNFRTNSATPHRDGVLSVVTDNGLINENLLIYRTNPDWATTRGPTLNDGDDFLLRYPASGNSPIATPAVGVPSANGWTDASKALWMTQNWSIDDLESALTKTSINTTYFNTGFSGKTYSGMWVTFPTKYLHYGFQSAGTPSAITGRFPVGAQAAAVTYRGLMTTVPGGVNYDSRIYNMTEHMWSIASPSNVPPFPWQVNFVPIGDISQQFFQAEPLVYIGDGTKVKSKPFNAPASGPVTYKSGYFTIDSFDMVDANTWGPFAVYDANGFNYCDRTVVPALNDIAVKDYFVEGMVNPANYLPPLALMIDYEMTGFLHTRAFAPQWDVLNTNVNP